LASAFVFRAAPDAFLASPADETAAMFSPDSRWLAYACDETGRREVYVQRYPNGGEKVVACAGYQRAFHESSRYAVR